MSETTLRLQANVPETIALEYEQGLAVSSRFGGDQVMFTLTDGRKLYLAPFVADKIAAAGIRANQPFTLVKREVSNGNRRTVEYAIETAATNGTAARVNQTHTAGVARNNPSNDRLPVPSQNNAAGPAPLDGSSVVALLKMAGCGAIDAVLAIEQHAENRGLTDFAFGVDNIQKFAACLFIELNKKAGRA